MNYETESWYKLYIRESTEDKVLPVLNRSLRDFLLRSAKSRKDPTILSKTSTPGDDLARALGAHPSEAATVAEFIQTMIDDGYLTHRKGRLWITNFVEAQEARTPGARRQKTYRDKKKKSRNEDETGGEDVGDGDVTRDGQITSQERRSDPRREDPDPPLVPPPGEKPKRRKPKIPIPADWTPNATHTAKATTLGLDLAGEVTKFRNHAEGKDARWVDWDKAFHNWLAQGAAFAPRGPAKPQGPKQSDEDATLLRRAKDGDFGEKAQRQAENGTLRLPKLKLWLKGQYANRTDGSGQGPRKVGDFVGADVARAMPS